MMSNSGNRRSPVHPGEILKFDFLDELGVTPYRLAKDINVPANRITGIVNMNRSITADTALRLARYFETSPEMWLNLQSDYELEVARRGHGAEINKIKAAVFNALGIAKRPANGERQSFSAATISRPRKTGVVRKKVVTKKPKKKTG